MDKQSRLSYNIDAKAIDDAAHLKKHLQALNPRAVLIMDGVALAREINAMLPDCTVIHRDYLGVPGGKGDDGLHTKVGTEEFLIAQRKILSDNRADNLWVYVNNEPGFRPEALAWFIDLIKRNALTSQPLKLVIGNWSVGVPGAEDWRQADELLRLLDKHREWLKLGLHEYACGVITSGFYGGYPNHAGVNKGESGGQNLIPAENWPIATTGITLWHCGRFRFVERRCREIGIQPPRIILTEHGMDDIGDVEGWASGLKKSPGYSKIRGWKTAKEQWHEWYPQWSHDQTYYEMLAYLDERVYQGSSVEAQCVFTWSNNGQWSDFDVQRAVDFQRFMEQGVKAKTSTAEMIVQSVPKPENASMPMRVIARTGRNLRGGPGNQYLDQGRPNEEEIKSGDEITVYQQPTFAVPDVDGKTKSWVWVEIHTGEYAGRGGFMRFTDFKFEKAVTKPIPVVEAPAPVDLLQPVEAKPDDGRKERQIRIVVTASDSEVTELTTAITQLFTVFGHMVDVWRGVLPRVEIVDKV